LLARPTGQCEHRASGGRRTTTLPMPTASENLATSQRPPTLSGMQLNALVFLQPALHCGQEPRLVVAHCMAPLCLLCFTTSAGKRPHMREQCDSLGAHPSPHVSCTAPTTAFGSIGHVPPRRHHCRPRLRPPHSRPPHPLPSHRRPLRLQGRPGRRPLRPPRRLAPSRKLGWCLGHYGFTSIAYGT
jgi:hypothetical protein